ncbi:MAG: hypothetical protein GTO18_19455 [Anaerolineales bacterium]|nr:hypothetical protein [Anaerolineales bacterium]
MERNTFLIDDVESVEVGKETTQGCQAGALVGFGLITISGGVYLIP